MCGKAVIMTEKGRLASSLSPPLLSPLFLRTLREVDVSGGDYAPNVLGKSTCRGGPANDTNSDTFAIMDTPFPPSAALLTAQALSTNLSSFERQ